VGAEARLPASDAWTVARAELRGQGDSHASHTAREGSPAISRWPGEGSLLIDSVQLLDADGREQALFAPDDPLVLVISASATRPLEDVTVRPAATFYRADGVLATNMAGPVARVDLEPGDSLTSRLELPALNLGDGRYFISVALYRTLSQVDVSEAYDLLDRSFEFEVRGNAPFDNGVFRHPGRWNTQTADRDPAGRTALS
jgi:hypothetical protein